ncbi:MAG: glycosyltransferase family 4 protein [Armatimonadota bacterium]
MKVLMVAHWDWVLYNFRLPLARALREKGFEVIFVCPYGEYVPKLKEEGFCWIHWAIVRRSLNPVRELIAILYLASIYQREQPQIVHHFTIKPNFYGSIAALLARRDKVINTFTGLGFLFSEHPLAIGLRSSVLPLAKLAFRASKGWSVFQNRQDLETCLRLRLVLPERVVVIDGSGVDTRKFHSNHDSPPDNHEHPTVVLMAARLLWDKGVREFVEAARVLKARGLQVEFWLAGKPDNGNPMCVPEEFLKEWREEGLINWLGHRDDMPNLLQQVDIAVLPSYHEGVPRFLLEAAACGLPLVATDIEGCRVVVRDGVNGFLVPVKDPYALADAIETLIKKPELRRQMGIASRKIVEAEFDERIILNKWLALYDRVLNSD